MLNVFFLFLWPQLMTLFPFWLFLWPIGSLGMCCLIAIYLWVFPFFDWKFHTIFVRKHTWSKFNTIKISKTCFEGWIWSVLENVLFALKKNVYSATVEWKSLYTSVKSICSTVLCNSFISLLIYIWMIHPLLRVGYWRPLLLFYCYFPLQIFLYMPYTSRFSDIRYL